MRRFLLLVLLSVATVVGWRGYLVLSDPVTGRLPRLGADRAVPFEPTIWCREAEPTPSVLAVPPGDMLAVVRSGYMALPDRRFLLAFAHAHHLLTGADARDLDCVFADGRWEIQYDGVSVGHLSDLASFGEAASLLRGWIRSVAATSGFEMQVGTPAGDGLDPAEVAELLDRFDIRSVADGMRRIDAAWRDGERGEALLGLAARGLTALAIQGYDRLQVGDALPARALAVLAMAQALTSSDLRREEALLAHELGYTADARAAAAPIPEDDAVQVFVDHDDDALEELASGPSATPLLRHLYGLRLVDTRNPDIAKRWLDARGNRPDDFGLMRLRPLMAMGRMETDAEFAALIPYVALYDLWRVGLPNRIVEAPLRARLSRLDVDDLGSVGRLLRGHRGPSEGTLARRFEADLVMLDARFPGPFLDGWTFRSHFAGHFYSALWQLATLVLDDLASPPQAQELVRALESSPEGVAAELQRWHTHLADASAGRPSTEALARDLEELRLLGPAALYRSYRELRVHDGTGATLDRPARELARRIDGRMENRALLGNLANRVLDLRRVGDYRHSELEAQPERESLRLWLMSRERDREGLTRFAEDGERDSRDRVRAFELLADLSRFGDDPSLDELGRTLVDRSPRYWVARTAYIEYLASRGRHREAGQVAQEWLRVGRRSDEVERVWARTWVARSLHALGEDEEAWEWVAPLADGEDAGAVGIAALILQDLGDEEAALRTAERLVERYPTMPEVRAVLAEVLWKQRRDADVVPLLTHPGYPVATWDWRLEVAPGFLAAFSSRPVGEAVAAVRLLFDAGVPDWQVSALGLGVARLGRPDLAFAFVAALSADGRWETLIRPLRAYELLRDMKGEAEGRAWIQPLVPPGQETAFAQLAFGEGDYELLWTVIDRPETLDFPEYLWLLRAAAHAHRGAGSPAREQEIVAHYTSLLRDPDALSDFYVAVGAHLVGLLGEDPLLALATAPDRRCEVAFFLGLKAEGDGRLADAADWYQVTLHTEQSREGEFHWADRRLSALSSQVIRSPWRVP